jgi:thymidylate kinase
MIDAAPWVVVTGLDGAGKSTLVRDIARRFDATTFRLPRHDFVKPFVARTTARHEDPLLDRLVFAVDARLTNPLITGWRRTESFIVSQRGWMDSFVFGAALGFDWETIDTLLRPADLERPSAIVHLIADPETAYERIRHDQNGDKYETLPFMRRQYRETRRFYDAVESGDPLLMPFHGIPSVLIDTTNLTPADVNRCAGAFLDTVVRQAVLSPSSR